MSTLDTLQQAAQENFMQAQKAQKVRYDQGMCGQSLQPGNQVLVSHQVMAWPAGKPWQGSYQVTKVLGPIPIKYNVMQAGGGRSTCM